MKITLDHMAQTDKNTIRADRGNRTESMVREYAGHMNVVFDGKNRVTMGGEPLSKGKETALGMSNSAEVQVQNLRNQMTVMSHTMSEEDYAKMQEEGFDPAEMEPGEAVTILDKIKAELIKSGEHIAGYTDNMDMTTLAAALGSESLAVHLQETFVKQDIPSEKQNVEQVLWALDMGEQIPVPTESTYYYMAANGLEATLNDFYRAGASGTKWEQEYQSPYFAENVSGYITKNVSREQKWDLDLEIEKRMEKFRFATGEEAKELAEWLVSKNLAVEEETILRMKTIRAVQFPLDKKMLIENAVAAIGQGISVGNRILQDSATLAQKAAFLYESYQGEKGLLLIQDRRYLEEVRLHMTVETNTRLLRSGFSLETATIEETIEALKQAEEEVAKEYFPLKEEPVESYRLYDKARMVAKELPGLPAGLTGKWVNMLQQGSLEEFYSEGKSLELAYKEAGERYEKLGTAPRKDLGDSLQKAFAGVDEIVKNLGYEATEENRKAIRILGYNGMELTIENVDNVKSVQSKVDYIIQKMTPAATLKMIRDGINPLEQTLPELEEYFNGLSEDFFKEAQKYSKFLYQLENRGEISSQEKEAYIGCYRLLHQIEKTDGAAIGALVQMGGEIHFKNLLSAVRSGKWKGMDVRVDNSLGALSEDTILKFSISEQINQAYEKEGAQRIREQLKEAAGVSKECFRMLERGMEEPSVTNLLAAQVLEKESHVLFGQLKGKTIQDRKHEKTWEKLENKEEFIKEYGNELIEQIHKAEEQIFQEAVSVKDLQERMYLYKPLHIMRGLAQNEEYYFPMEIGESVTGVHLQFTHNDLDRGLIRITLESEKMGRLSGTLQVKEESIEGYFVGNRRETVMYLKNSSDIINKQLHKEGNSCDIDYVFSNTNDIPMDWTRKSAGVQVSNKELYSYAKRFLQAIQAVGDDIEKR